jgi:hypothetical protein
MNLSLAVCSFFYTFALASLVRPAPAELPQDRKVARVGGRSGAMPGLLFYFRLFSPKIIAHEIFY